jgi:hypothetical protein
MEVTGQLHATAILPPGGRLFDAGWRAFIWRRMEKYLSLQGIELLFLGHSGCVALSLYLLSYPRSPKVK